jgi:nucleoid-associated protein YgaU
MMTQQYDKYVVKAGDSLSAIAQEVLGDVNRWKEIWEANKAAVPDPNAISVGQELLIPVESKSTAGGRGGSHQAE